MNPALWLTRTASRHPGAPALMTGERVERDYQGFARQAANLAAGLRAAGVQPGDRVAILLANCTAYLEILYAVWFAGAAAVPINHKLHPREAAWIVEHAAPKAVFTDEAGAQALSAVLGASAPRLFTVGGPEAAALAGQGGLDTPTPMRADDLAWLFYTSGTTGRPKGAMLSCANLAAMSFGYLVDVDAVHATDAALYAAPMSHGAGLYNFMHVMRGARHVVPESGGFDAEEVLRLAAALRDVSLFAAPTMVRRLVDAALRTGSDGDGLRTVVYGGGPMYVADIEEAVATLGPRFVQIYGQGETPMTISVLSRAQVADRNHPRWRERLGSVGVAQAGVEVRVAGPEGREVDAGGIGEVQVRGAPVMLGYWNDPTATAAALQDGWLCTGDMGVLDPEGFLTLKDRSKDVIISGGSNIYPREVEEVLLLHPGVHEAAVIGRPDPEWGEVAVAYFTGDATPEALDALCVGHIARFKRPKAYVRLPALPKNNNGKIVKTELRILSA
jgi:long-chain acyl-CoA synthetase